MKNKTTFIRVEKDKNYSVIHNEFLRRKDLSWKAKGILSYILTLPDDWEINIHELMNHATDGEKAFRSGWKELETSGYVRREPVRNGNRIDHWETIVSEKADMKSHSQLSGFVHVENEDVQNVHVQNEVPLSTEGTKYLNKQSTDYTKERVGVIFKKYNELGFGQLNGFISEQINEHLKNFEVEVIVKALEIASNNNKRHMGYVNGILHNWYQKGWRTLEKVDLEISKEKVNAHKKQSAKRGIDELTESDIFGG